MQKLLLMFGHAEYVAMCAVFMHPIKQSKWRWRCHVFDRRLLYHCLSFVSSFFYVLLCVIVYYAIRYVAWFNVIYKYMDKWTDVCHWVIIMSCTDDRFDAVRVRVLVYAVVRHGVSNQYVCHAAGERAFFRRQTLPVRQRRQGVHLLADIVRLWHDQLRHFVTVHHRCHTRIQRRGIHTRLQSLVLKYRSTDAVVRIDRLSVCRLVCSYGLLTWKQESIGKQNWRERFQGGSNRRANF